jgi:hypothetical protein
VESERPARRNITNAVSVKLGARRKIKVTSTGGSS